MDESSLFAIPRRLVTEGEQLVLDRFPGGSCGLVFVADVKGHKQEVPKGSLWQRIRRHFQDDIPAASPPAAAVCVPSGAHLILKRISGAIQQKYGLESEEGAVLVQTSTEFNGYRDELWFNNGARLRLQELPGQIVEVLWLAGTHPDLYERELQML